MKKYLPIIFLFLGPVSMAEVDGGASYSASSIINHDGQDNYIYLGNGYNSDTYDRKHFTCLSGREIESGNVRQIVETTHNFTFDQARRVSSGDLSVSVSSPMMSAGAGAEWAYDVASSDLSQSINMTIFYKPKKDVIIPSSRSVGVLELTPVCMDIVNNRSDLLTDSVGNEFVAAIDYIASLSISLIITSSSKKDRDLLAGALRFSRLGVALDGELSQISNQLSSAARVSLNLRQVGGDPAELIRFGAENGGDAVECSMAIGTDPNSLSKCLAIFDSAISYAKNSFKGQLQDSSDYAVSGYYTSRYDISGQEQLLPEEPSPIVNIYRDMKMIELYSDYAKYRQDNMLANSLIESSYGRSEEYISSLESISELSFDNLVLAMDIMEYCEVNPYGTRCIDYFNSVSPGFNDYGDFP